MPKVSARSPKKKFRTFEDYLKPPRELERSS